MPAAAAPSISAPGIDFVGEQLDVISAPADFRQLVEAGPGTGKTAVACARIVKLLRDGLNPSSVLMISFTRSAVREMRDRVEGWQSVGAGGVKILTIDQTAYRFAKGGGSETGALLKGFEVTIETAVKQLAAGQGDVVGYVRTLRHVLVDEAQDITDIRADFVETVLATLPPECGVTVLADGCQSIYGFTSDQSGGEEAGRRLFLSFCRSKKSGLVGRELTKLHRTKNAKLAKFFTDTRKALSGPEGRERLEAVLARIEEGGEGLGEKVQDFGLRHGDFVLFRKRVQALHAANWYPGSHRLRLPGYPAPLFAWIGLSLSEFDGRSLSQQEFSERWKRNVPEILADGWSAERAFEALRSAAGGAAHVDMNRLRASLSQPRPPIELCYPDYGAVGPVFSTIHASKGRESDRVVLMLPRNWRDAVKKMKEADSTLQEEARVMYVGATRVRSKFSHGLAATLAGSGKLKEGNDREVAIPFQVDKKSKFQFGRSGDLAEERLVSARPAWCGDEAKAKSRQAALVALWRRSIETGTLTKVIGKRFPMQEGKEWRHAYEFRASTPEEELLGYGGRQLVLDLLALAGAVEKKAGGSHRPPKNIPYLQLLGLRTVVVGDDALAGELCAPYSESRIFLAPMITGFANIWTLSAK